MTPTKQCYDEFQQAYRYFNRRLFDGALPECLITLQRKGRTLGYFCHNRFVNHEDQQADEIALNPAYFAARTVTGVLSTLVHEMVHLWQYHYAAPGRKGYHNLEWAARMKILGLYPSDTGEPGGRETGDRVTHYIVEDGPFDGACRSLLADGFRLSWIDNDRILADLRPPTSKAQPGLTDRSNRLKFTCPRCASNAWARPSGSFICGQCYVSQQVILFMEPNVRPPATR